MDGGFKVLDPPNSVVETAEEFRRDFNKTRAKYIPSGHFNKIRKF